MVGSMAIEAADTENFFMVAVCRIVQYCKYKTNKYVRGFTTDKVSFLSLSYYGYIGFWGGWGGGGD
jgi:hypothetical protein